MTLRTELSILLSALLAVSIGVAGGTAIVQSARTMRRELITEYRLFAENRAFALRDNIEILESELRRLAALPEMLPEMEVADQELLDEERILRGAHENSVLYNAAVLLVAADGRCVRSVPQHVGCSGESFADRPWFGAVRQGTPGPLFRVVDEPGGGRTLKIIEPLRHQRRFMGALVGIIALEQSNLISRPLQSTLPARTEAILVESKGTIVVPTSRGAEVEGTGWRAAVARAISEPPGTLDAQQDGERSLFAFAPVGAGTGFAVVFRWPWSDLFANVRQQVSALAGLLLVGIVLATGVGLLLAAYLTRPLAALGNTALRIAHAPGSPVELPPRPRTSELVAVIEAFATMERSIRQRDQELREAAASLERRVTERTGELVKTQQALVEAERFAAMGKTSAAIAHELKNALNGIGMAVELIVAEPTNQARLNRLQPQLTAEIARLRDVVDSLLSFSRSPRLELGWHDVVVLVHRALEALADRAAERDVTVTTELPASLPVRCDGHKIQGVLVNLIKNAMEAGRRVHLSARMEAQELLVDVSDDGPGLSPEAREHLFEPFFTTKPNGTGLGLPTSQRYVSAHGGQIAVATSDWGGARLRLRLPQKENGSA